MPNDRPSGVRWATLIMALALFAHAADGVAQTKEKCKWPGSMWATSANLYLKTARENPRPEESRRLYEKALEVSLEGMAQDPDNSQHYMRGGEALVGLSDFVGADSLLDRAEAMEPACQQEIRQVRERAWGNAFNAGVGFLRSGDENQALIQFEKANAIFQGRPEALLQLGVTYSRRADRARLEAAAADSATAARLNTRADSLVEAALAAYRTAAAVAQKPEHQEIASFNLAQILALNDRFEEAVEAYTKYLEQRPDNVVAQTNRAIMLTRWAEKLDAEEAPESKARAEELRKRAQEAYKELLARAALNPDDAFQVGAGLLRLRDLTGAAQAFRRVLNVRPYDHEALLNLANAFYLAEKGDSLLPVAQELVTRYPNNSNYLAFLAWSYRETGAPQKALEVIERREQLPFEVDDLDLAFHEQDNSFTLSGRIRNLKLNPGAPVAVRFEFLDEKGQIVATQEISQPAPEQGATTDFEIRFQAAGSVAGFRYAPIG